MTASLRLVYLWCLFSACCSVNAHSVENEIHPDEAQFKSDSQIGCPKIFDGYELVANISFPNASVANRNLALGHVLHVPMPGAKYQTGVKRYAILETIQEKKLKVTIILGGATWSVEKNVTCEDGWLRLEHSEVGGSEGNTVRAHSTVHLTQNPDGDLAVKLTISSASSAFFGLVQGIKEENSYWLIYRKINGVVR